MEKVDIVIGLAGKLLVIGEAVGSQSVRSDQLSDIIGTTILQGTALRIGPFSFGIRFTVEIAAQSAMLILVEPRREDSHVTATVVNHETGTRRRDDVKRCLVSHFKNVKLFVSAFG